MLVGLLMVYSTTVIQKGYEPLMKQAIWALLSVAAIIFFANFDYHILARNSQVIIICAMLSLVGLFFFTSPINGAQRWYRLPLGNIQPSEFMKIAMIIYVADYVARKGDGMKKFLTGFAPPLVVMCVAFGLIILQPDFGTASVIFTVAMTMLIVGGIRMQHLAPIVAVSLPIMFILLSMKEYRLRRLLVFLNPWDDPQGAGYHVVQSLIALGCGGFAGMGWGRGLQKLGFLPEAENDFVFAAFGQDNGFIGCVLLLGIFTALFISGLRISKAAPDVTGSLIALGVTVLIGLQMLINVAVAESAVPTKGISLPFVSLGGSAMLALSIGIGILLNVARHTRGEFVKVRGAARRAGAI